LFLVLDKIEKFVEIQLSLNFIYHTKEKYKESIENCSRINTTKVQKIR